MQLMLQDYPPYSDTFGHSWKILSASWKAAAFNFHIEPIKEVGDMTFLKNGYCWHPVFDKIKHHTGGKNAGFISISRHIYLCAL